MFRALYQIQKDLTMDFVSKNESVNGLRDATSFAKGGRVISAAFTQNPRTAGQNRVPLGKTPNAFGDVRDQPGKHVVEPNGSLEADPDVAVGHTWESQAQFPFDAGTGEPCSLKDFLYLAPRDARGNAPSHVARDQRVRLTFDGEPLKEARAKAVEQRKGRRKFYNIDTPSWPQDLKVGDYEIPAPMQDYGKEIAYQVMEEALNELLDPLFKEKEDLATEARAAQATGELEMYKDDIERYMRRKEELRYAETMEDTDPLMAVAAAAEEASRLERPEDYVHASSGGSRANGHATDPVVAVAALPTVPTAPVNMDAEITTVEAEVQAQELEQLLGREGFGVRSSAPSPTSADAFANLTVDPELLLPGAVGSSWADPSTIPTADVSVDLTQSHHLDISTQVSFPTSADPGQAASSNSSLRLNPPPVFMSPEAMATYMDAPTSTEVGIPDVQSWDFSSHSSRPTQIDPTMPQFRPNSERDIIDKTPVDVIVDPILKPALPSQPPAAHSTTPPPIHRPKFEAEIIKQFEHMFLGWERDPETGIVRNSLTKDMARRALAEKGGPPSDERLQRLVELKRWLRREDLGVDGPVGLGYEEFIGRMKGVRGGEFAFLEGWLEVCYF
jgi:hypothetical protein